MDNKDITEMSFDEIFPEVKFPEEKTDTIYGSNVLTDDDSTHQNYDTECEYITKADIPNNIAYNTDNDLNFTDNSYQNNNNTNTEDIPTVSPKTNNYSSFLDGAGNNQDRDFNNIPFFNNMHMSNNEPKIQFDEHTCLLMGTLALFLSFFGFGFIFSIFTFITAACLGKSKASNETKMYKQKKLAIIFAIIAIIISFIRL